MTLPNLPRTLGRVVMDTNVLLDWLVFSDPAAAALAADINERRVDWIRSEPMRQEWREVLARPLSDRWEPARKLALTLDLDLYARRVDAATLPPQLGLPCTDPADQMFIDLALAHRARWLVSRDRALLKLARRARPLGLQILRPVDWQSVE